MIKNLTDQLWTEVSKLLNRADVQHKIREFAIIPVIQHLIRMLFPYFVTLCVLFGLIIILLIIVIYNQILK